MNLDLMDEYKLTVHPVILGNEWYQRVQKQHHEKQSEISRQKC